MTAYCELTRPSRRPAVPGFGSTPPRNHVAERLLASSRLFRLASVADTATLVLPLTGSSAGFERTASRQMEKDGKGEGRKEGKG